MIHTLSKYALGMGFLLIVNACAPQQAPARSQGAATPMPLMAQARGMNTQMLDTEISVLVAEARDIQSRVEALLERLETVRTKIAYMNPDAYRQTVNIAGQRKDITLPVPERPEETKAPVKITNAPKPIKGASTTVKPLTTTKSGVRDVRVGQHNDKTRIVMDVNGSLSHNTDYDREVGVLTIELDETSWDTALSKTYGFNQVKGYQARSTDGGTILAMAVANTSSVQTSTIQKTGGKPARLVIDLMK